MPAAATHYYIWYRISGDPAKARASVNALMRDVALQNFRDTMAEHMNVSIFINVIFAAIIAWGVVYNSARISLSERSRELASLRVLGFTRAEISLILLGEIAILTTLALPTGVAIGYLFGRLIMSVFTNEVYRLSFVVAPATNTPVMPARRPQATPSSASASMSAPSIPRSHAVASFAPRAARSAIR